MNSDTDNSGIYEEVIESFCEEDTFEIGRRLGEQCHSGDIILLEGNLGSGKTVFTKGFGMGLGIEDTISSPTFTIMQIYNTGRIPLYHFDVYRIGDIAEMDEIGYEDYFFGSGVCIIEWSSLIKEILPDGCINIRIEKNLDKGCDYRIISISR